MLIKKKKLLELGEITDEEILPAQKSSENSKKNIKSHISQADLETIKKQAQQEANSFIKLEIEKNKKFFETKQKELLEREKLLNQAEKDLSQERQEIEYYKQEAFKLLEAKEKELVEKINSLNTVKQDLINQSKPVLLEIVTSLTSKLIDQKVKESPEILERLIQQALYEIKIKQDQDTKLDLRVNPKDIEIAKKFSESLTQKAKNLIIKIHEDENIMSGSCSLEGMNGCIDLNFNSQLEAFKLKMR